MGERRTPRALGWALAVSLVATLGVGIQQPASAADTVSAASLLGTLTVSAETVGGYDRSLFEHWIDADGDGCDTRSEVLQAESQVPVTYSSGCTVATGQWTSWYDGQTWTLASDVDIDHMVPLAEAWASGASTWTAAQRRDYANDLQLPVALEAVTDNVNQSKGDQDPAEWMPPLATARCDYAIDWMLVKYRWRLTIDPAESNALASTLGGDCGTRQVTLPAIAIQTVPVSFADVTSTTQFYTEISWLASRGVSTGWVEADGGRSYRPLQAVNRDAMAAFMYRLAGSPAFTPPAVSPFTDVHPGDQFYTEITWLAGRGITTGWTEPDGTRTFRPLTPVNRDAMAAFMYRFAGTPAFAPPATSPFIDVATWDKYYPEITWLAGRGISTGWDEGYGCRSYRPGQAVNRDAMAAFMYRLTNGGTGTLGGSCNSPVTTSPTPTPVPRPPAPAPTQPANPGDTKNCSDFGTWQQAQDWFNYYYPYYGDVGRLDADGDRVACETLPGHP